MTITKSRYVSGIQCRRRIWLELRRPELAPPLSTAVREQLAQGQLVGAEARLRFPGGLLIHQTGARAIAATRRAIRNGVTVIYEATFAHEDLLVRCDILVCKPDGRWDLIEVKSSTDVHPEHIDDLAIQRYVVEQAGCEIAATKLMYINAKGCCYPDLTNLFLIDDLTAEVACAMAALESHLATLRATLEADAEPAVAVGAHCKQPHPCAFHEHCWAEIPTPSIYSIPKLDWSVKAQLANRGKLHLTELPPELPLTPQQKNYVNIMVGGQARIDAPAIRARLRTLAYPIYFFDFETDGPAIPRHAGLHPYQAFPFQYSCHILHEDGSLAHVEYLHMDEADPRRPLITALLKDLGQSGSVVVYYAAFERTILLRLSEAFPEYSADLCAIVERLWDQWEIFRTDYQSPAFEGSTSIKHVLPALVPTLSYAPLAVRKGDQAQAVWRAMVVERNEEQRAQMAANLKEYCGLDTYAMVELHRHLERIASDTWVASPQMS
ncbi:MAG: DUF2779 domain-containing protein [Anaerolineales bacterium]|nr:DUF2779 domain-containing protein [Anaerolineales bacterium]